MDGHAPISWAVAVGGCIFALVDCAVDARLVDRQSVSRFSRLRKSKKLGNDRPASILDQGEDLSSLLSCTESV